MIQKFLFVLFATIIYYNGVVFDSTAAEHISGGLLSEENTSTVKSVTTDHINKKVETTPAPTPDNAAPVQNASAPFQHDEIPAAKNTSAHSESNNKNSTIAFEHFGAVNETQKSVSTSTITRIDNKNITGVTSSNNITEPIANKTKYVTGPVPVDVTNGTKSPIIKPTTPIPATLGITSVNLPTTNTSKPATVAPNPTDLTKNSMEHDSPAPAHTSHFEGSSFIGGIVLTLGLTAIGFIAFKYYKSGKIDMNYRTL